MSRAFSRTSARMGLNEFAALLEMDEKTVRKAMERRELPGLKVGNQWVIFREAVDRLLSGDWQPPVEPQLVKVIRIDDERAA